MQRSPGLTLTRLGVLGAVAAGVVGLAACTSSSSPGASSSTTGAPVTNVISTGCSLTGSGPSPTGHTLNLEEPELFNRHVAEFIAQVEAGRWAQRDPRADPAQVMRTT